MKQAFLDELDHRFETRSWSSLEEDFPGVGLVGLDRGLTLHEQTSRGILVDDVLYLDACPTRYGDYAFCEQILLPSYSLAKTLHIGLVTAAMAQELDIDPYAVDVSELLPRSTASAPGNWEGVTVEHLLDMTTGHYRYEGQSDDYMGAFFLDYSLEGRLQASLSFPYREPPGQRAIYLTPNYQVAAAALDVILEREGAGITDSFELAVERIYKPAGVTPDSFSTLRTWDGGQNNGTAFGGYGLVFTPQGLARLGAFVLAGGVVDGVPSMKPARLDETLFRDLSDTGAPMNYSAWSYNNGMWGYPLERWGCEGFVPIMFGVSGVTAMFAPNGVVYFTFNDVYEQPVQNILDELDAIRPLCGGP